jgi:hypothetical protein
MRWREAAAARVTVANNASGTAVMDPEFSFDEVACAEYAMQQGFEPFRQAD